MLPTFTQFSSIALTSLLVLTLLGGCGYKTKPIYVEKSSKKANRS